MFSILSIGWDLGEASLSVRLEPMEWTLQAIPGHLAQTEGSPRYGHLSSITSRSPLAFRQAAIFSPIRVALVIFPFFYFV
jgi:hypothetical protein